MVNDNLLLLGLLLLYLTSRRIRVVGAGNPLRTEIYALKHIAKLSHVVTIFVGGPTRLADARRGGVSCISELLTEVHHNFFFVLSSAMTTVL